MAKDENEKCRNKKSIGTMKNHNMCLLRCPISDASLYFGGGISRATQKVKQDHDGGATFSLSTLASANALQRLATSRVTATRITLK